MYLPAPLLARGQNIATIAAGYVVDELPQSSIADFLKKISLIEQPDVLSQNKYL